MISDIDLRIFKALSTDQTVALDFANHQKLELFSSEWMEVAKGFCAYLKAYKKIPTKRVLTERQPVLKEKLDVLFNELGSIQYNASEYPHDFKNLKDRYIANRLLLLQKELVNANHSTAVKSLEYSYKDIQSITTEGKTIYIQKPIKQYLPEFRQDYIARAKDPSLGQGILTGYSYLDYITNGVRLGELWIIGADTSAGKSLLLNNIAIQMWMQKNTFDTPTEEFTKGCNVLYFSLEMPYEACFRRTMARLADVPIYGLRDSTLSRAAADSVSLAGKFIQRYPYELEIVDIPRGLTVEQLEEIYNSTLSRYQPDVIIIDYLGLMDDSGIEGDDWLKLGHLAGKIHEFSRAHNTRILTAVQLNRLSPGKTKPEEIVGVHRFGRSSLIAHHANVCLQIESRPDEYLRSDLPLHLIKVRDGGKGSCTLSKRFSHASIFDIPFIKPENEEAFVFKEFNPDGDISEQLDKILGTEKE